MQLTQHDQCPQKSRDPKLIWKDVIYTFFRSNSSLELIHCWAESKKSVSTHPIWSQCRSHTSRVINTVISDQFVSPGFSGDLDCARQAARSRFIESFILFACFCGAEKVVPIYFSRRMLQPFFHCEAPEMFCRLRKFTQLSYWRGLTNAWILYNSGERVL